MFSLFQYDSDKSFYIESFTFKDGQPHVCLNHIYEMDEGNLGVRGRITNAEDLFKLQLIVDVLKYNRLFNNVTLSLSYLMGGRMDREISFREPSTLKVVCNLINSLGFSHILLYDCHSVVSQTLLRATNYLPQNIVNKVGSDIPNVLLVIPDAGAQHRVDKINKGIFPTVQCLKTRNPKTQELSNFMICEPQKVKDMNCLIVDDICDGGRTFVGLAKILKEAGAKQVDLFITHGIFSYGYNLEGITNIYTTNSYQDISLYPKRQNLNVFEAPFTPIAEPAEKGSL